jgi:hypothetical protein
MASQKDRPTALQWFFWTSTYNLYAFTPEKPLSLVGRNFCLAISRAFASAPKKIVVSDSSPMRGSSGALLVGPEDVELPGEIAGIL